MTILLWLDPIEVEVVALGAGESGSGEVVIDAPPVAFVGEAGDVWQHALDDLDVDGSSLASDATHGAPRMFLFSTHAHRFLFVMYPCCHRFPRATPPHLLVIDSRSFDTM